MHKRLIFILIEIKVKKIIIFLENSWFPMRLRIIIQAIIHNKNDARALRKRILLSNSDLSNIFSQFVADLIVALSYSIKESIL